MALIIGLTGSIGTGKSTVSKMFRQLNIPVVDADVIAREVVEPTKQAYNSIIEAFGQDVLLKDETIDRKKLGSIIFANEEKRKKLNAIIHPAIRKEMLRQKEAFVSEGHECVVLDIPLLFESKLEHYVDKILVVYVDPEVQLQRILKRDDTTVEDAKQRINSQIPITKKRDLADAIIDNNGSVGDSFNQLKQILIDWNVG